MLALYGHPFSSYTWKALIALYACATPFEFRMTGPDHPEHNDFINAHAGPWGKFPVLRDGDNVIFEATTIVEYLSQHTPGGEGLLPPNPDAAIGMRMLDRVFDNYVMNAMQVVVDEYFRDAAAPDLARCTEARARLEKSYDWIDSWLEFYPATGGQISLIECSAAPALFYADWIHPIDERWPRLKAWRAWLLALAPVARCVEEARPYRPLFPPGSPGRD